MEIKCCMVNCTNVYSDCAYEKTAFYGFPRDFNQCMMWVQNTGRPEYFEDFAFAGAQPFLYSYICSDHFNDTDFVAEDPRRGLLQGSIPNLNLIFKRNDVKEPAANQEHSVVIPKSMFLEPEIAIKSENDNSEAISSSFSSGDDSCNDLHSSTIPTLGTVAIYKETEADKQLSNEFFKNYQNAIRGRCSTRKKIENDVERTLRLKTEALRARIRRSRESEEQKKLRKMKNALRAAFRRQNETSEQRELRKKKDMLRSQRRRKSESETETRMRRFNDAVRAAFRRNNETEQQRMERKMKDILRAAKRRSTETPQRREERLRKDRERASKKRMLKKMTEQMIRLDDISKFDSTHGPTKIKAEIDIPPLTMSSSFSV